MEYPVWLIALEEISDAGSDFCNGLFVGLHERHIVLLPPEGAKDKALGESAF